MVYDAKKSSGFFSEDLVPSLFHTLPENSREAGHTSPLSRPFL